MAKIKIKGYRRSGFYKDVKPGPGVKMGRIAPTRVRGHMRKDTGKPGRTPEGKMWFEPGRKINWSKEEPQKIRLSRAIASRPKSLSSHDRNLSAFRALNALANVTTDRETETLARKDARALRRRL